MRYVILHVLLAATALGAPFDWTCPRPTGEVKKGEYFSPGERARLFPAPSFTPDFSHVDKGRVHPRPEPGVHPRVLITPGDLPEIRERIKTSEAAAVAYEKLKQATEGFYHEGDMKEVQEAVNPPDVDAVGMGAGEEGEKAKDLLEEGPKKKFRRSPIQQLVDGVAKVELITGSEDTKGDHVRINLTRPLALNALRALIDEDEKRGRRVAKALATYGRLCQKHMKKGGFIGAYRPVKYMTLAYDYAAPFMTDKQKGDIRKAMAMGLTRPFKHLDGAMYGVCHPRPSHNWVSLVTQYIMMMAMSIEGEDPGIEGIGKEYVDQAISAMSETSARWVHYFWGKNGASFEGMGKCQLKAIAYVPLARRDNWLICHPHVRRAVDSFYPSIMQPEGYKVTAHSGWGGSGNPLRVQDVLPMKWLAPEDPAVDCVYRNAVGDDYGNLGPLDVIYAMDWTGPQDWEKHAREADVPVNFLDPGRAMLCARSSWDKNATWLQFVCDQQWTAHMQHEIGNFLLTSHGKTWAQFIHANDSVGPSSYHSVLLIDGVQQQGLGRMVEVAQNEAACFATADWAPTYNRYVKGPTEKPTINDYHPLDPINAPYADMKDDFSWRNGWQKFLAKDDWTANPAYEVEHAFRTIGLVRGPHPYVLVVDDVKKDDQVHLYEWFMQVERNVVVARMANRKIGDFSFLDMILTAEKNIAGEGFKGNKKVRGGAPCLLVRLLRIKTDKNHQVPLPGVLETWNNVPDWPNTSLKPIGKRLKIQTWAVSPEFRILLYPHRSGEELPKTQWAKGGSQLQVIFKDQMDEFTFDYLPEGRPRFILKHDEVQAGKQKTLKFGYQSDPIGDEALPENEGEELFDVVE